MPSNGRPQLEDPYPRYLLLLLGGGSYFCLTFIWFSLPAYLSTIIDDLGLTGTEAGILAGAVPLTYIPLALVTGVVIDRIGPRLGIGIAVAVFSVAQILRGYAPDFPTMLVLTLLVGVGATGITFGLPKLVAELFPEEWVGTASSVYLVWSSLGSATVFGIGRPVLGPMLGGWRALFVASGLVVLGYVGLWAAASWWTIRRGITGRTAAADEQGSFSLSSIGKDLRAVIMHREMALLVVIGTMYLFVNHGLKGWIVTIFEAQGIPPSIGGPITSVLVGAHIVGVLTIPPLADRVIGRREGVVGCGLLCIVGSLLLLLVASDLPTAALSVVVIGLGVGGIAPLVRAIPVELEGIGPRLTATAVGLVFAIGEIGGFLGPVLIGFLRDVTGTFDGGILLIAGCGAVVVLAGLAIDI